MTATPENRKKKLLVVSSYGVPCGIAQYAEHLVPVLGESLGGDFEVDVAPLDVRLLKTPSRIARRLARSHLAEIESRIRQAAVVNLQFEPGLLGTRPLEIQRRLKRLLGAADRVIITHHTVLEMRDAAWSKRLFRRDWYSLAKNLSLVWLLSWFYRYCRARPEKFFHIVQTPLDRHNFTMLGLPEACVAAHPLAFLSAAQKTQLAAEPADDLRACAGVPEGGTLIGVFGFLTEYKGIEVAIRAMDILPEPYRLLIVGGHHPEGVVTGTTKQPYLHKLMQEIYSDYATTLLDTSLRLASERVRRIQFAGHVNNERFAKYMAACDVVVLPYAEVGQRSSGPASMALDLDKRTICSRNICFSQLNGYAGAIETFEIGSHVELAQKLAWGDGQREARQWYRAQYNIEARARLYRTACETLLYGV